MWKQGTQQKYTIQACRDAFTKAKTHLKLNLVQDGKGNRKGFSKYTVSKRHAKKNLGSLLKVPPDQSPGEA